MTQICHRNDGRVGNPDLARFLQPSPMLVDQAEIYVRGGKGGDGCVSFRREKFVPRGGPDGGDGGDAGSVCAVATPGVDTLLDFAGRHHWIAENGRPGEGRNKTGRAGRDLLLKLPLGTLLFDRDTNLLIKDLTVPNERVPVALGGKGGRGNARFARANHQTPREAEPGTPGQERWLRLELKLIADVGIVGLPNAGKSTLLRRLSKARPRIAAYPFTTLQPQLGIAELSGHRRLVLADLPGLIEGAHQGTGLGDTFLKHIERTRVLLHLVDVGSAYKSMTPARAYRTIRVELTEYSAALAAKKELIVGNKVDLTGGPASACALSETLGREIIPLSAATGEGLDRLVEALWVLVSAEKATPAAQTLKRRPPHRQD